MRAVFVAFVISIFVCVANPAGRAQAPKKGAEWIPLPQVGPQPIQTIIVPEVPRPGSIDFWKYYGVDSFGRFRPRVVLSPAGAYDLRTLDPYPWLNTRNAPFLPIVLGAPGPALEHPALPFVGPVPGQPFAAPTPARVMPYAIE